MISARQCSVQVGITPSSREHLLSIKRSDLVGLIGFVMFVCGFWFIFTHRYPPPLWITWIVGPMLWYVGGATTVVWLLWRVFGTRGKR